MFVKIELYFNILKMLKLRLFKSNNTDYLKLLEETSIPRIDTLDDLHIIVQLAGKLLSKYVDSLQDPNLVSVAIDTTNNNWSVTDYKCFCQSLQEQGFTLLVTKEPELDIVVSDKDVAYLLVDSALKDLGIFPESYLVKYTKEDVLKENMILKAIKALFGSYNFYDKSKFLYNPIELSIEKMKNAQTALGSIPPNELNHLLRILASLDKRILAFSHD